MTTTPDTTHRGKPHFEVLDGLRGTAAMLVVAFHIQGITVLFEANRLLLPHAYLAVDFFFALSGFVVGYAYDDRWGWMSVRGSWRGVSFGCIRWWYWARYWDWRAIWAIPSPGIGRMRPLGWSGWPLSRRFWRCPPRRYPTGWGQSSAQCARLDAVAGIYRQSGLCAGVASLGTAGVDRVGGPGGAGVGGDRADAGVL